MSSPYSSILQSVHSTGSKTSTSSLLTACRTKKANSERCVCMYKGVPQRTYGGAGGRRYSSCSFTNPALDGVSGQRHAPVALYPRGEDPCTHSTGGWVGPRAGLDTG
jgi:hypothetical protein